MKVIVKKVGSVPEIVEIENTLEAMQQIVGGYIETVYIRSGLVMICNEEGKLHGLNYNFTLGSDHIVGDVLFARTSGEDFTDLDERDVEMIMHFFSRTPYTT